MDTQIVILDVRLKIKATCFGAMAIRHLLKYAGSATDVGYKQE